MKTKIYLCGHVFNDTFGYEKTDFNKWRQYVKAILSPTGMQAIDPFENEKPTDTPEMIVNRCLDWVEICDLILLEADNPKTKYIGTMMELMHAYDRNKPIIAWGKCNKDHPWLQHIVLKWFDTLDEALEFLTEGR